MRAVVHGPQGFKKAAEGGRSIRKLSSFGFYNGFESLPALPFCRAFHRAGFGQWQSIAGGKDSETPLKAAQREAFEGGGVQPGKRIGRKSLPVFLLRQYPKSLVRTGIRRLSNTWVRFGFACHGDIRGSLSPEQAGRVWLPYEEAAKKLEWGANRTAPYKRDCRLEDKQ